MHSSLDANLKPVTAQVPVFVTGSKVVWFDPATTHLPVSSNEPGKMIDFVASPVLESYADQFQPCVAFGSDMRRPLNGTLFRLGLRTATQAATSPLSEQVSNLIVMQNIH